MNKVQKVIELEIAEHFYKKYQETMFCPVGYFKPYDFISKSGRFSVEVKFEEKARDTWNLFFEHSYRGKPSGLVSTQASWWVHAIPIDVERISCLQFHVSTLRKEVQPYPLLRFCGDHSYSTGKLLSVERAVEIATDRFELRIDWALWKPYWT